VLALWLFAAAGVERRRLRIGAFAAALLFAIHPMRVEPVAWASAFPYILALIWLLASTLAYLRYCDSDGPAGRGWYGLSIGAYILSLLSRVTAIGYPLVLVALDVYPLARLKRRPSPDSTRGNGARWAGLIVEKAPFAIAAVLAAIVESRSRDVAPLGEIGIGARITMTAAAPLTYLGRTLLPLGRSPVDPLPIAPRLEWGPLLIALGALGAITFIVWTQRRRWPSLLTGWMVYLVLLAPVMGLTPSGQTATADRYTYVPAIALSMLAGAAVVQAESIVGLRRFAIVATVVAATLLGAATWRQTRWWHDSITLWSRAADLDSRNDIATFNLAVTLEQANRKEEAIARYQQTLALIPDHQPARRALTNLKAERGLALTRSGRFAEAREDLRAAFDARPDDPALASALSYSLAQIGRAAEAAAVLKQSLEKRPDNDELAHNLARLLATSEDSAVRDGALALRLALAVRERTGGRDPRVLDTLALAYAATGQWPLARKTAAEAAALARQLGQSDLADEIDAHARAFQP
jgi:tetratricopeptide (TPR) repeat protein